MILGIESTAHTFGIGIVSNGKILSNVREMYTTEKGGIIPMESAKHHSKVAEKVFQKALAEANASEGDIDAITDELVKLAKDAKEAGQTELANQILNSAKFSAKTEFKKVEKEA